MQSAERRLVGVVEGSHSGEYSAANVDAAWSQYVRVNVATSF
jgi:hypothetical protein